MSTGETSGTGSKAKIIAIILSLAVVGVVAANVMTGGGPGGGPSEVDVTISTGETIVGALDRGITTEGGETGTPVGLTLSEPMDLGGGHFLPEGTRVRGEVTHTQGGGRMGGAPELTIRFSTLVVDGEDYSIQAEPFRLKGKSDTKETVAEIGGGAILGGVVGAVTGAGTLEGAAVGAVLGTGVAVVTKGDQIVLPSGQKLRVRLTEPVTIRRPVPSEG